MLGLFSILLSSTLWSQHVFCDSSHSDSAQLEELFKKKHMSNTSYVPWEKLKEASFSVMEEICKKCSDLASKADKDSFMTAAGEKTIRNSYGLHGHKDSVIQLDTIKCSVTLFQGDGEAEQTEEFSLAEGDEPNSAFQFTVSKDLNIVLTRKVKDLWT